MIDCSGILASEEAEIMLNMLKAREQDVDTSAEGESEGVNWGFRYYLAYIFKAHSYSFKESRCSSPLKLQTGYLYPNRSPSDWPIKIVVVF